ncbi:helix-turn-helix domain-containing protein [Sphingomonas sp. S2-65]|uniref:helix-turn-helix domain-containing protein n=1 Tax=Sphingomonas sp. S2-65 TaxID=2903960 RepID=UPI001F44D3D6|nr:helix-turn-helix transcriptional regulator [Sphingomonas sp. S2-65]UYY58049.1 helix-turn-helix transcriptional regulator [Sphingomonas sp. S2-65]
MLTTFATFCLALLRELRGERGRHQAEVAEWLGVTPSAWTKVEMGSSPLKLSSFVRVCAGFEVHPSVVMAAADRHVELFRAEGWKVLTAELAANEDELLQLALEYWASAGSRAPKTNYFGSPSVIQGPLRDFKGEILLAPVFRFAIDPSSRERLKIPGLGLSFTPQDDKGS